MYSPPPIAVRVNTLWFASLVFSLAAASFGMLVKQWLREYLACEFTSPQARLRIRQRRYPSMRAWQVYTIAAQLPLLLQTSLGLFFVGLCFFTWSIDQTVARATIVLVCAWAFLLLTSIVLPIFYPDCPYRTTAFLRLTVWLRSRYSLTRHCVSLGCSTLAASRFVGGQALWLRPVFNVLEAIAKQAPYKEEAEIANQGDEDVLVLVSVDAAMTDDNILVTTIWDAAQQLQLQPDGLLAFLFEILSHRLSLPLPTQSGLPLTQLLDLRSLSSQAWAAVTDIGASILSRGMDTSAILGWSEEMKSALTIMLSHSSYPLPSSHVSLLRRCLENHNLSSYEDRLRQLTAADTGSKGQILLRFRRALDDDEASLSHSISRFTRLATAMIGVQHPPTSLWEVMHGVSSGDSESDTFSCEALNITGDLTARCFRDSEVSDIDSASLAIVTHTILHIAVPSTSVRDFRGVFRHLCDHVHGMRAVLAFLAESPPVWSQWTFEHVTGQILVIYYTYLDDEGALLHCQSSSVSTKLMEHPWQRGRRSWTCPPSLFNTTRASRRHSRLQQW